MSTRELRANDRERDDQAVRPTRTLQGDTAQPNPPRSPRAGTAIRVAPSGEAQSDTRKTRSRGQPPRRRRTTHVPAPAARMTCTRRKRPSRALPAIGTAPRIVARGALAEWPQGRGIRQRLSSLETAARGQQVHRHRRLRPRARRAHRATTSRHGGLVPQHQDSPVVMADTLAPRPHR
jgi:hypothetical protein